MIKIDTHKKKGRPTKNPLIHDVKVRLSEDTHEKLLKYCEQNQIEKAKVVRNWIEEKLSE